MQLWLIIDRF